MKPDTVPTAPAQREQRSKQNAHKPRREHRIGWLMLSVILSLTAGFISSFFMLTVPVSWPTMQQWLDSRSDVVIVSEAESTATVALVESLEERVGEAIVPFFVNGEFVGVGTAVSNDGWVMTIPDVADTATTVTVGELRSDSILRDPYLDVRVLHIPTTELSIVDFQSDPILRGDGVIVLSRDARGNRMVSIATIQQITAPEKNVWTTAAQNVHYTLDRKLIDIPAGSPVFDYQSKMIGIFDEGNVVVPLRTVEQRLKIFFETGSFELPTEQLEYSMDDEGATILSSTVPEILSGDVIIQIEGQFVERENDLSWLLADVLGNEDVDVLLLRNGKRTTVSSATID